MTASPEAQVPMNQDNTEIVPVPVGAPHIDQSKYRETHMSDVVDELTVPDAPTQELHQPAHFRENIDGFTDQGSRFTKGQKWMAIGAGILTLGAGVLLGKASSSSEPSSQSAGSDVPSTSAPAVPGVGEAPNNVNIDYSEVDPNTLTQEEFFTKYPESLRIKDAIEYIDAHFDQSLAELNQHLREFNRTTLPENTPRHMSEDMDISDILNYHSVVNWMAANLPTNEKERVLSAIVDTESPNRQDIMDNSGPEASSGVWEVNINDNNGVSKQMISPMFKSTPVQGYNPDGSPSYVAVVRDKHAQTVSEVTLRYTNGQWTLHTVLNPKVDMDRWITYPEQLQVS